MTEGLIGAVVGLWLGFGLAQAVESDVPLRTKVLFVLLGPLIRFF